MLRQLEFSLFDLRLHDDFDAQGTQTVQQLLDSVRSQVAVLIPLRLIVFKIVFHIFFLAVMQRVITVINGQKYCRPMRTVYLKKWAY
jgi:hypothetical protein